MHPLPADDLQSVVERVGPLWERLRGKRLLVTGATGFIGRWMVESYAAGLPGNDGFVMGRSAKVFGFNSMLDEAARNWFLVAGDVCKGIGGDYRPDYILHLAGPPASHPDQREIAEVIQGGTRRVCDFAKKCGASLLFASSGAAHSLPGIYAVAKAIAEASVNEVNGISARIYATYGPGMNLDRYALGNFIRDGMNAQPIRITGDARTVRSWIYAADLAAWLWTMLLSDKTGAWPVGSEESMSLSTAAYHVAECFDFDEQFIDVQTSGIIEHKVARYVPDTSATRAEFGVRETVRLEQGLRKTVAWLKEQRCASRTTLQLI